MTENAEIEFSSLKELYDRLKPALTSKKEEMHHLGYNYIHEEDIWNYLKEDKWISSVDLLLFQMVDDVINANPLSIDAFFKEKMSKSKREINVEEE